MSVKIRGFVYKIAYKNLMPSLFECFGKYNLKTKVRQLGEEFHFENETMQFDCYSALDNKWPENDEQNFIIDASLNQDEELGKAFIDLLSSIFTDNNIMHEFEYMLEDEDGNEISDEVVIRPAGYDDFMNKYY